MMFNMWEDYLGLNKLVMEMAKKKPEMLRSSSGIEAERAVPSHVTAGITDWQMPTESSLLMIAPSFSPSAEDPGYCTFCRHNGESREVYRRHTLKGPDGKVQCPILQCYVCPQCGATGEMAHTRRFCPLTAKGYCSVYRSARNSLGKTCKGRGAGSSRSDSE
uniref:Nanos C2HC-type zinc finger 3 n=1 Tax=Leptobrachium leishanense TaxID=445787 RepID=A0A8C5MMN0_9ANUR